MNYNTKRFIAITALSVLYSDWLHIRRLWLDSQQGERACLQHRVQSGPGAKPASYPVGA
jgi:hypothetical protein